MFPEYRELITSLKGSDAHFDKLFNEHNQLDKKIKNLDKENSQEATLTELKSLKLQLKDELKRYLMNKKNNS